MSAPCPITEAVRADLLARSAAGFAKYGTTLARTDLDLRAWLQHAYEECLDQAQYLRRAIAELDARAQADSATIIAEVVQDLTAPAEACALAVARSAAALRNSVAR